MIDYEDEDEDDTRDDYSSKVDGSSTWMTSYADIVTLLLCFFILFFNIDNSEQDEMDEIVISLQKAFKISKATQKVGATAAFKKRAGDLRIDGKKGSRVEERRTKLTEIQKQKSLTEILRSFVTKKNLVVKAQGKYVLIDFKQGHFFQMGSYELTDIGKKNIDLVYSSLKSVKDRIFLEIQGHTDPTPVAKRRRKFSSNLELSALRAMSAYVYLTGKSMNSRVMSISGFGHHKSLSDGVDLPRQKKLGLDRRVSFRMEMK